MKIHLDKVDNMAGFAAANAKQGDTLPILVRGRLTSDDPDFYRFIEHISLVFLSGNKIFTDSVHQFLVIIHADLSADLYINDFVVMVEMRAKREVKAGEMVSLSDIADVRKVQFHDIDI